MLRTRQARERRPVLENLEGRAMLSGLGLAGPRSSGPARGPAVFRVDLMPENGSGVSGQAVIVQRGDRLRVSVMVRGLEPGTIHASHIHGFAGQPQDRASAPPPPSAADDDPSPNGLGPGITSETESTPFVGPIIKTLSRGFRADARGVGRFRAVVDVGHQDYSVSVLPLGLRMVEVHGMTVDGVYQQAVPVAGGMPSPA